METTSLPQSTKQMAEHFIPLSQSMILKHLLDEKILSEEEKKDFRRFFDILRSMVHFEFHSELEKLKESYHPFDPDPTTPSPKLTDEERERTIKEFDRAFNRLMERANFVVVGDEEIKKALKEESPIAVEVEVDLNEYSLLRLFTREKTVLQERVPFLFIFHRTIKIEVYDRLVLEVKFSENKKKRKKTALGMEVSQDKIYLKYFRNVPVQDIEMIFPDPRIQMRTIDKIKILVPLLFGIGISYVKIKNMAGGSMNLYYTAIVVGALFAYVFRGITSFINTKNKYIKRLTQGLYFKNLDNNAGVFHAVTGEAEEEEVKEAILGYYFLLTRGEMAEEALDKNIEEWFSQRLGIKLDFDVSDALNKLRRWELVEMTSDGRWKVIPLRSALEKMDSLWDNIFDYHVPEGQERRQGSQLEGETGETGYSSG